MGIVQRRALMRVFNALGASMFHGSVCGAAGNILEEEGRPRGSDPEDQVEARFVLMWGSNLLSTAHHAWYFIDRARKRNGARIRTAILPRGRSESKNHEAGHRRRGHAAGRAG